MKMLPQLEIDVGTLKAWILDQEPVVVIDIRPENDYEAWNIPGSRNVDAYQAIYANSPGPLAAYTPPDHTPVVVVCYVGQTSRIAAQYLKGRGIQAVSLAGGMQAWSLVWNLAEVPMGESQLQVLQVRRTGKGCLSYLIASQDEALVIDPSVEPEVYLELAGKRGWRISRVLDTHVHADHLSRGRSLARVANAEYYLPIQDRVTFEHQAVAPHQVIEFGETRLEALPTPGHTFESLSFLLEKKVLFTGDTLFPTSVGRPDLKANPQEARRRAQALHKSLHAITRLNPGTLILAGHASQPVAFDGVPIVARMEEALASIPALGFDEGQFVAWILDLIPPQPPNYERIVSLNESGQLPEIGLEMLEAGANNCAVPTS